MLTSLKRLAVNYNLSVVRSISTSNVFSSAAAAVKMAVPPGTKYVLSTSSGTGSAGVSDVVVEAIDLAPNDFVSAYPRGGYTTARTVNQHSVFELDFHIRRMASSIKLMMEADDKAGKNVGLVSKMGVLTDAATFREPFLQNMRASMKGYLGAHPGFDGELKITSLVCWEGEAFKIYNHVTSMGPRPAQPVKALCRGAPRQNALAKDSEWVRARKVLEETKPADVNEILLVGESGELLEGMSSNFFAVRDGTVYTAGEGVLSGTVREVALECCKNEGIPVVLEAPKVSDLAQFEGAFLSSTSRLVLPLHHLAAPDLPGHPSATYDLSENSIARRVERAVLAVVESKSGRVL